MHPSRQRIIVLDTTAAISITPIYDNQQTLLIQRRRCDVGVGVWC